MRHRDKILHEERSMFSPAAMKKGRQLARDLDPQTLAELKTFFKNNTAGRTRTMNELEMKFGFDTTTAAGAVWAWHTYKL